MPYAKPIPAITPEMKPFFEGAKRHELRVQECAGCGARRFPARPVCSTCLSFAARWVRASGRGEVFSFTVMHRVYHPGFAAEVPYAVVLVQLAEGPKMTSNLLGVEPRAIRVGMPVRVVFDDITAEVTLPRFVPE
ncbi:MAG: Zn-ribbon domain-containing OB-fold protein [Candidatus Binatia bacterium]